MRRRLITGYLALTVVAVVALAIPLGITLSRRERATLTASLTRDAETIAAVADEGLEHPSTLNLTRLTGRYRTTGAEVSVVDRDGRAVVALHPDELVEEEPMLRQPVRDVLAGRSVPARRVRDDGNTVDAVVAPIGLPRSPHGAVVVTYPTAKADAAVRRDWTGIGLVALVVLGAATLLGFGLARSITAPLAHLERAADALGRGDLTARAPPEGPPEVSALARTFNDMAERLEELLAGQRAFVADASHQLRAPLTALRLRLENLETAVPAEVTTEVRAAAGEARRLSRLVDGLLALARAEGTRTEMAIVDVADLAADRRAAWEPLAAEQGVELRLDRDGTHGAVLARAVPGHLEQVLDNLLANALEATPAGGCVTLHLHRSAQAVEVHVVDEGPGMTPRERAHAFDRFWRGGDRQAGPGGTGLGLAIVAQLTRASGGHVELSDAKGGGLDAGVRLSRPR